MEDFSKLASYIQCWQSNNFYVNVTIRDMEINPYVLVPGDKIELFDQGVILRGSIFYNWSMVRSIKRGGRL
jgi:hypothetical protein